MIRKRLAAFGLALGMAASMGACSKKEDKTSATTAAEAVTATETPAATKAVETTPEESSEAEVISLVDLEYWAEDSEVAGSIKDWVAEVTDPASDKYIPPEDRIVVSDLDGTLIGELFPTYFDWCMFVDRALYDETYDAPEDMKAFARELEATYESRRLPKGAEKTHAAFASKAYAGMTLEDYVAYVRRYMDTEAVGFTNLTKGQAFYKPMVSLINYLNANDFIVYIVSGSGRYAVRTLVEDVFPYIPPYRVLGTDITIIAQSQGDTDGLDFVYSSEDHLVLGDTLLSKNVKMNKVSLIAQEIGKVPVLSLGNSSGDISMAQYVMNNSQYDARAYMLLCDDTEREYGKLDVAESFKKSCEERGFITVSMRDDFATIYGEDVEITEKAAAEPAA